MKLKITNLATRPIGSRVVVVGVLRDLDNNIIVAEMALSRLLVLIKQEQYEITNYPELVEFLVSRCGFGA